MRIWKATTEAGGGGYQLCSGMLHWYTPAPALDKGDAGPDKIADNMLADHLTALQLQSPLRDFQHGGRCTTAGKSISLLSHSSLSASA